MNLAIYLNRKRDDKGLTHREVGEALGIKTGRSTSMLRGEPIPAKHLEAFAELLDLTIEEMLPEMSAVELSAAVDWFVGEDLQGLGELLLRADPKARARALSAARAALVPKATKR